MVKQQVQEEGRIPAASPTEASLEKEGKALGDAYPEVRVHPADLIADGEEMLLVRDDAKELAARGYPVTPGMFDRVALLIAMLASFVSARNRSVVGSEGKTAEAEKARARLATIREILARIADAVGLDPKLFSLASSSSGRLSVLALRMRTVLDNAEKNKKKLPDAKRVESLIAEGRDLIEYAKSARTESKRDRSQVQLGGQLERLLLDVLQHLSKQGLAAFEEEGTRKMAYRLDHVYGKRSKNSDPPVVRVVPPTGVGS